MSVGKSKTDCSNNIDCNDEFGRLKLKYSKKQPNLLDGTKVKLPKYKSKDVYNLKQKYTVKTSAAHVAFDFLQNDQQFSNKSAKLNSNLDKSIGKIKSKRSKKQRISDPEVSSMSEMMSNSLLIESPEKGLEKKVVNVAQSKSENENDLDRNLEETEDQKLIGLKNIQSPLYEIKSDSNPVKQQSKHLTNVTKTISKDYKSKSEENSDLKSTKIIKPNNLKNVLKSVDLSENENVKNLDTDSIETELKSKKLTDTNSKSVKACDLNSKLVKNDTKSKTKVSKLGKYSPKLKDSQNRISLQEQNQSKESPPKINAFAFMMGNRNKVIGTNSDGKNKEEEVIRSPEIVKEKKQKLGKRKQILENWAEKKVSAIKRKLEDQAQEKYIARTLNKRAKRMKKMLNIGEEDNNDEDIVKNQTKKTKNRKSIIIDSESSNDAYQESSSNISPKNIKQNIIIIDQNTSHGILNENPGTSNDNSNAVPEQKIFENSKQADVSEKTNLNSKTKEVVLSNGNEILEIADDTTSNSSRHSTKEIPVTSEFLEEIFSNSDPEIENNLISPKNKAKDLIKIKMDFTPKKHVSTPKSKKKSKCSSFGKKSSHKSKTQSIHVENEDIDEIFPEHPKPLVSLENKSKLDGITKTPINSHQSKLVNTISNLDIEDSNSEQLQQFTPRTWRMRVRLFEKENLKNGNNSEADVIVVDDSPEEDFPSKLSSIESSPSSFSNSGKKQMKLAPLFLRKSKKDEQAALQAKKNFLFSTSPSTKKIKAKQPSNPEIIFNYFPKVSHVQQRLGDANLNTFWDLPNTSLCIIENDFDTTIEITDDTITLGMFTECKSVIDAQLLKPRQLHAAPRKLQNTKQLIQEIKNENESYPVFKIFRLLREKYGKTAPSIRATPIIKIPEKLPIIILKRKRGRPKKIKEIVSENTSIAINVDTSETTQSQKVDVAADSSMWTEKYKPQSRDDIIGNSFSVDELKSWLSAWLTYSEDQKTRKRKRINSSSSDDFCSDSSTRDTESIPGNTIILTGPYGSGKTASVYALSNELNINVIEINASSKRTGKKVLSELQEATQSHQVKNTESKSVGSYFQSKSDKTEEDSNKKFSLLLVEDIDIVFEDQDDGFLSALGTLVTTSKRPMILTTTDPNSSHLQKFISQHRMLIFNPFSANTIGTWLQILCLVENIQVNKSNIAKLLQWNKGDIRKTMLQLQFWTQTGGDQLKITESETYLPKITTCASSSRRNSLELEVLSQDDNSNLSWLSENDINVEPNDSNYVHQSVLEAFVPYYERDKKSFQISYPANLGTIWWNMSSILNTPEPKQNIVYEPESLILNSQFENCDEALLRPHLFETQEHPVHSSLDELEQVKNLLESLAFADIIYTSMKVDCDLEPTVTYWQSVPSDSLSFSENLAAYDASNNVSMEIVHWLLESNIKRVQKNTTKCDVNVAVPPSDKLRRRTKQHNSMEELLVLVPLSYVLERRVICEDYQPMLRLINRIEAHRCLKYTKRKNRFYHYLKTFNLHLSNSTILTLCNTLAIDKHTF